MFLLALCKERTLLASVTFSILPDRAWIFALLTYFQVQEIGFECCSIACRNVLVAHLQAWLLLPCMDGRKFVVSLCQVFNRIPSLDPCKSSLKATSAI